jgi:hypothetical protein
LPDPGCFFDIYLNISQICSCRRSKCFVWAGLLPWKKQYMTAWLKSQAVSKLNPAIKSKSEALGNRVNVLPL